MTAANGVGNRMSRAGGAETEQFFKTQGKRQRWRPIRYGDRPHLPTPNNLTDDILLGGGD
jgi:hypothetical protein